MTCQDCELWLVQGEMPGEVEEHLRQCGECRALQKDLRENTFALEALKSEELPRLMVKTPWRRRAYPWVAAAAAALFALALLVPRTATVKPASPAVSQVVDQPAQEQPPPPARETAKAQPVRARPQKFEPLKIKMLTSDPDVVIYWLIEN